jgi:hypothetical protein
MNTLYLHHISSIAVSAVEKRGAPSDVPGLSLEYWVRDIIIRDDDGNELAIHVFSRSGPQALEFSSTPAAPPLTTISAPVSATIDEVA